LNTFVAALAHAIKTVLPHAGGQGSVETELASLTAQVREVLAHFRISRENKSTEDLLTAGRSPLSKSFLVN
jgi:hypothetical protein